MFAWDPIVRGAEPSGPSPAKHVFKCFAGLGPVCSASLRIRPLVRKSATSILNFHISDQKDAILSRARALLVCN